MTWVLKPVVIVFLLIHQLSGYHVNDKVNNTAICTSTILDSDGTLVLRCKAVTLDYTNIGYKIRKGSYILNPTCNDSLTTGPFTRNNITFFKLLPTAILNSENDYACVVKTEFTKDMILNLDRKEGIDEFQKTLHARAFFNMMCDANVALDIDITNLLPEMCLTVEINLKIIDYTSHEYAPELAIQEIGNEYPFTVNINFSFSTLTRKYTDSKEIILATMFGSGSCCSMTVITSTSNINIFTVQLVRKNNTYEILPYHIYKAATDSNQSWLKYYVGDISEAFQIIVRPNKTYGDIHFDDVYFDNCKNPPRKVVVSRYIRDNCLWHWNSSLIKTYLELCELENYSYLRKRLSNSSPSISHKLGVFFTMGLTSITSEPLPAAGQACTLLVSSLQTVGTGFRVNIIQNNVTFNVATFNRCKQVCSYNHQYLIGSFENGTVIEIQVFVKKNYVSGIGIHNIELTNCSVQEVAKACDGFRCNSGICISYTKVCDIVLDCWDGEDESHALCNNTLSPWKCSFENIMEENCSFVKTNVRETSCNFEVVKGTDVSNANAAISDHTTRTSAGHFLYLNYTKCKSGSEIRTEEIHIHSGTPFENCSLSVSSRAYSPYNLRGLTWYCYICDDKHQCQRIHKDQGRSSWTTVTIQIPDSFPNNINVSKFYIRIIVSKFMSWEWIAFDDIYFSAECISDEQLPETAEFIKNINSENSAETMLREFVALPVSGIIICVLVAVVIVAVHMRRKQICLSTVCSKLQNRLKNRSSMLNDSQHINVKPLSSTIMINHLIGVLAEDNPNYEWYSERILNDTIINISSCRIRYHELIGKGAFGEVFKGVLIRTSSQKRDTCVAIKKIPASSSEQSRSDLLLEALTLSKFKHPNIVQCLGISADRDGLALVLEFLPGGDLKTFLCNSVRKKFQWNLDTTDLMRISIDIVNGCQYLEQKKFVHRDLAARNCLLTCTGADRRVKLADFGLARDIKMNECYCKLGQAMLPIRWMSQESFIDGVYTTKSDVWAYGILLWEVFSYGETPYTNLSNTDVIAFVSSGKRMNSPANCPVPVYNLMRKCWEVDQTSRPSFKFLHDQLILIERGRTELDFTCSVNRKFTDCDKLQSKDCLTPLI